MRYSYGCAQRDKIERVRSRLGVLLRLECLLALALGSVAIIGVHVDVGWGVGLALAQMRAELRAMGSVIVRTTSRLLSPSCVALVLRCFSDQDTRQVPPQKRLRPPAFEAESQVVVA